MSYQNPQLPEGINVTAEQPLKDFLYMLLAVCTAGAIIVVLLLVLAEWLVLFIPFEAEQALVNNGVLSQYIPSDSSDHKIEQYLNQLASEIAAVQQLPPDMTIVVHYIEKDTVNAFASLGGHIVVFKGLMEILPSENALAMLLAHEMAHIKNRDPIIAAGRGITVGLALASVFGAADNAMVHRLLGQLNFLTVMAFSRDQETSADDDALNALYAYYGHVNGAEGVFVALGEDNFSPLEFLSSHPVTDKRIENVYKFQQRYASSAALKPLPKFDFSN